jgi:hypothetical protein
MQARASSLVREATTGMWGQPPSVVRRSNAPLFLGCRICRAWLDRTAEGGCPHAFCGDSKTARAGRPRPDFRLPASKVLLDTRHIPIIMNE